MAGFFRSQGLGEGARVAIILENSFEYVACYYGALAEAVWPWGYTHRRDGEKSARCWPSVTRALWYHERHPDFDRWLSERAPGLVMATRQGQAQGVFSLVSALEGERVDPCEVERETLAAIVYTSGTTTRPKGVLLSHGNLSSNASSIVSYLQLTAADRVLNVLPFTHAYRASILTTHLATGASLVLENQLVFPRQVLARIAEEQITGVPGVPSTFETLLRSGLGDFDLSSVRYFTQAGGAMSPQHSPTAQDSSVGQLLRDVRSDRGYRSTDVSSAGMSLEQARLGRVTVPDVEIEIRNERDEPLLSGETGQVCARGPNVMRGYHRDEHATASVLREWVASHWRFRLSRSRWLPVYCRENLRHHQERRPPHQPCRNRERDRGAATSLGGRGGRNARRRAGPGD